MIKASDRSPTPPKTPSTALAAPDAEPDRNVSLLLQVLDNSGKLVPFGSIELRYSDLELLAECVEHFASSRPRIAAKLNTKAPTRLIVTKVDTSDKDFVSRGGMPLVVGEVISTPDLVDFLKVPGSKLNASLVRYYVAEHKPFEHSGYTLRSLDDFLRDLRGPAGKDFQAVAEAHGEWAEENNEVPFQ